MTIRLGPRGAELRVDVTDALEVTRRAPDSREIVKPRAPCDSENPDACGQRDRYLC